MGMLGFIFLSGAISVDASRSSSSEYKDAYKAVFKAAYLQSETDKRMKELEERINPEFFKKYGGWIAGVGKIAIDKKVSFEWTF